ncbi:MAG: zinc-ribbon domain-containing protein [Lachnospiraceae bacterium]|jgi:uncharacterized membrane protein YvbJ|nr:zinc-ribbon domain-containing protein [Lachnospiraceae bacterium]
MFCPKCGTKNDDDALFCSGCGEKLSNHVQSNKAKTSSRNKIAEVGTFMKNSKMPLSEDAESASFYSGFVTLVAFIYIIFGVIIGYVITKLFPTENQIMWILGGGVVGFIVGKIKIMIPQLLIAIVTNTRLTIEAIEKRAK